MDDFDFSGPQREPDYDRTVNGGNYANARARQGFTPPYDRSPVSTPSGWYGGDVAQTGGMIMVRQWSTLPDGALYRVHQSRPGREVEYEVAYGDNPGVSINRYRWNGSSGTYEWGGVVEERRVSRNTDAAKARSALALMKKHSDKTQ